MDSNTVVPQGQRYLVSDVRFQDAESETFRAVVSRPSFAIRSPYVVGTVVLLETYPAKVGENIYLAHADDIVAVLSK